MREIQVEQNSLEWEALRRTKVGASDIAILMTGSEREIQDLWEHKVYGTRKYVTKAMQHGTDTEAEAREWMNVRTGKNYKKSTALHEDHDWLMASLDGWDREIRWMLEIKVPSVLPISAKDYHAYQKAWWQIQAQHCVYCPERADLLIYVPGEQPVLDVVARDEEAISKLVERGKWFYSHMVDLIPPTSLGACPTERNDEEWAFAARSWADAQDHLKEAEEREAACRAELIALAGETSSKGFGVSATKSVRKGNIEYGKIPELGGVDLDKFRKPNIITWKLTHSQNGSSS
jgi:putative phage-type endonuclease